MYLYIFLLYFLLSCSVDDQTENIATEQPVKVEQAFEENNRAEDADTDQATLQPPLEFFSPLLNGQFSNCFSKRVVLSSDFKEGLAVYELSDSIVLSPGKGVVSQVSNGRIQMRFQYIENGSIMTYNLSIHHIDSHLDLGDTIYTSDTIGFARVHENNFQIAADSWTNSSFNPGKWPLTNLHQQKDFMLPENIKNLIVIEKTDYHFWYFLNGQLVHDFPIALGQDPLGHKVQQGDNKTPEGLYTIVEKMKGPFNSPTGPWLGNSWFRLNYPNKWDAETGYKNGLITKAQKDAIVRAFNANRDTPNNTKLGGHIGIHGWNGDWYEYSTHDVTWGCVSMRNHQIDEIYDEIPVGTKVFILP